MKSLASATVVLYLSHFSLGDDEIPEDISENVYVSSAGSLHDLEASATGYVFQRNGNGPGQYINYGGHNSGLSSGFRYGSPLRAIGSYGGSEFGPRTINAGFNRFSGGSGFSYPAEYSTGSIGGASIGGDIGLGAYNDIGSYGDFGGNSIGQHSEIGAATEGIAYGGSSGSFPLGNIGYGISKNGIGLAGLTAGSADLGGSYGLGGGIAQTGTLGYGIANRAGPVHGQYIPITASLGRVGQVSGGGIANEASFAKGGGENFQSDQNAAKGRKGAEGYKTEEAFEKGEKGEVDKEHQEGGYSAAGGAKKGEEEEAEKHAESEVAEKGTKGESFSKSGGHKKGHKTSGFHNVYHKDEYKKDTSFYDSSHASGEKESYGSEDAHHAKSEGAHESAKKAAVAYHEDDHAKGGAFTNGHQYGAVQGHEQENGAKEHYGNEVDFANEAAHKTAKKEGHAESTLAKKIY